MNWNVLLYALMCVIVPLTWGLIVYSISTAIEHRVLSKKPVYKRAPERTDNEVLPLEYHI